MYIYISDLFQINQTHAQKTTIALLLQSPSSSSTTIFPDFPNKTLCLYLISARIVWAFSAFALVRNFLFFFFSRRKQESKERTFPPPHPNQVPIFPQISFSFFPSVVSISFLALAYKPTSFFIALSTSLSLSPILVYLFFPKILPFPKIAVFCLKSVLMSKKGKAVTFNSSEYEGARVRLKHQSLMQDYVDLQKEADSMRRTLDTSKQKKLILAAEVRFLRRRYKQLVMAKDMNAGHERLTCSPILFKQTNDAREQLLCRNIGIQNGMPTVPESKSKKYSRKQITYDTSQATVKARKKTICNKKESMMNGLVLNSDPNHKGRALAAETTRVLDKDWKERLHGPNEAGTRNSVAAFDLNQDSRFSGEEASFPRAPIFDLNEISVGDEDFQSPVDSVKFEEARKSLMRGVNDEQQNDLKLSFCRSAGEGPVRVGKRKISWQDPVALRV